MANLVVTWMYCSPPGEEIAHAQVGSKSDSQRTQDLYWRCAFCLFESSYRLNTNVRHLFFVNKMPPREIDSIDTQKLIDRFNIEIIVFQPKCMPPKSYHEAWATQFILIDILQIMSELSNDDDNVFILDSDCIFNNSIAPMVEALESETHLGYTLDYSIDRSIHGHTRRTLCELANEYDPTLRLTEFHYAGGELICATGNQIPKIAEHAQRAYKMSLERHYYDQRKFLTESHLFSFVYHQLGFLPYTANRFIKRIWTDRSTFCNVLGDESELIIWHLPAEKKSGFRKMFRKIGRQNRIQNYSKLFRIQLTFSTAIIAIAVGLIRKFLSLTRFRRKP